MSITKIDYKKELKPFYAVKKNHIEMVDVPSMNYLMVDGRGNPNTSEAFQQAIRALYTLSYTLKFMIKKCIINQ